METMTESGGVIPHHHHHPIPGSGYFPQKDASPSSYFFPHNAPTGSQSSSVYRGYGGSSSSSSSEQTGDGVTGYGGQDRGHERRDSEERGGGRAGSSDGRRSAGSSMMVPPPGGKSTGGGGSDRYHLPSSQYSTVTSSSSTTSATTSPYQQHPYHQHLRGMNPFLHQQQQQQQQQRIDEDKNKSAEGSRDSLLDPASRNDQTSSTSSSSSSPDKRSLAKDGGEFSPKKGMLGANHPYDTNSMMSPFYYGGGSKGGRQQPGFMPDGRRSRGVYEKDTTMYMSDVRDSVKEVYDSFMQARGMNSGSGKDIAGKLPEAIPVAYDDNGDAQSDQQQLYREKLERSTSQDAAALATRNNGNNNNNSMMMSPEYSGHPQMYDGNQQRPRAITMNSMYSRRDSPSSFQPSTSTPYRGNGTNGQDLYTKMREHFNRSEAALKNHYYFLDKEKEMEGRGGGGERGPVQPPPMSPTTSSSPYLGGKHQRRPSGDARSTSSHTQGIQEVSSRMMMMMSPSSAERYHHQSDHRQSYPAMHHYPHHQQKQLHLQQQQQGPVQTQHSPDAQQHHHSRSSMPSSQRPPNLLRKSLDGLSLDDQQGPQHSSSMKTPNRELRSPFESSSSARKSPITPGDSNLKKRWPSSSSTHGLASDKEDDQQRATRPNSTENGDDRESRNTKDSPSFYKDDKENRDDDKDMDGAGDGIGAKSLSPKGESEAIDDAQIADSLSRKLSSASLDTTSLPDALPRELLPPKKELMSDGEDDSFQNTPVTFRQMSSPSPSRSTSGIPSGYPTPFPHPADNHSPRHHHQQPPLAPQSLPPHPHHPHQQHHQQQQPQPPFFHSSPGRMPQPAFGSSRGFQDGGPPSGMPPAFPFNKDIPSRFPIPGLHHDMGPMGPSGSGFMGGPMSQMNVGGEKDVYFCHLCSYSGKSKPDFDNHMGIHFEYNCPHCDYTSRTEGRLKRHIKDFHTDENGRRSMPGRPKIFKCKQCSFSATEKDKFWEHARSHIKEDKLLQCPKCSFVTEYKHHLEYHLRNHFGSKPFKCNKCNYSCVNKSMLNSHMKSHTNVYQYRCSDCTYATKYCHSLKLHLKKYNHKPATVLNQDGSLPQGADVDASGLSVNTKRGPPRGPRGPRKEKGEPYFGQMFPGMPAMPMGIPPAMNPMLKGMMPFWPMVPPPPSGIPGHPGMMSGLPNMPPHMGGLRGRGDRDREDMRNGGEKGGMLDRSSESEMNGIMSGENSPSKEDDDVMYLPCKFCDFLADGTEALCLHLLQSHKDETGEMASMYGLSETALAESLERAKRLRMHKSDTRIERQMSEFSNDSELDMSEFKRRNTIAGLLSRDGSNFGRLSGDKAFWTASGFGPRDRRSLDDGRIQDLCYVDDGNDDGDNENETSGGMDILQQMTLKFGGGGNGGGVGVGNLHTERTKSVEVDMEDDHERENIQHGEHALLEDRKGHGHKESPLDLTKPKSLSPSSYSNPSSPRRFDEFNSEDDEVRPAWFDSEPRSELDKVTESLARKRQFSEAEDTNSLSAISGTGNVVATHPDSSAIVPRKRSRKGKAYKLETLCLKLQERHSLSPNDSDDPDNEMNDLEQYSFLSSESGDKDDVVGGNEKSREKEVEEKKSKVDSVEGDVDEVKQEEKTEDKNGIVFKTERQESECDKKEVEEGAEGQNIEMETGKKNIETENEKKDDVSDVKVEPLEDGDASDEMKVKESGEGEESLKEGENSQMIKKESESDAAESSFEQLQEAIEDLSKGVTEEEREQENENVTEKGSALSDTPSDEHENKEVNDNGDDNEDNLSLLNKISQIENENNTVINEDDDDAKTEILGEDLSSTRDDLFDLSDKENSNDGYECFENVGSPSSNKPASEEIQIEDKVDMINTVIENRKKPLPPAVRRGTELAWKLLNDPVNPVTSIPIPAVSPPPPPEWKNPSQPQLPQQPQRSSSPLMSPRAPNNMTSLPPPPTSHPHHHLVSGNNMSSPVKNGMRAPHPFHQIGLPPSPSINLNAMKPHFPIPLPPTPMAFIPPTNRMLPEHPLPRPPPPQITPPPTGPPSNNKPMPKDMYECTYCDLSFRDCVMYTVHMGYHSNRNPFKCNSCGIICRDKVEFFLHIARSPHS